MDDDEIALADSFINFEFAAYSPTSYNPPDPFINESGSSDPDPPVGSSSIEERIGSFGLVEKEVDENEGGGIQGEVIANDDDDAEDGEIVESEDGEIRGDVIADDDEIGGEIMGLDDAVGTKSEKGEIRGDVLANDDEIRGKIVANDDVNATVTKGSNRESECSGSGIKIDEEYELEEGEILESDNDRIDGSSDDDSQEGSVRLTDKLEILPRVPPVNVELGPHHIMLPLGVVTSIVGARVVVEGSEKHDPLDQGSVLWITGRQTPLGVIDDTFAQVKNPYYVVRYNSESEIPEGVHEGTLISFVVEFAKHVLNSKDLYKKGSDASGMHDEEVTEETEFSDDEQEAEYNRIQKQAKRGQRNRNSNRMKNNRQHVPLNDGSIPKKQMVAHGHGPPIPSSGQGSFDVGCGHSSPLPGTGQGFSGVGHGHSSAIPPLLALPQQPPVSRNWPSGFPTNSVAWYPENTQNFHQQPMQGIPFQQQFNPSHRFPPPTAYPGGHFPQFQAPTYFQLVNISGNLGGPPQQFNPPTYFHSPPIAGNQGGPSHQFSPPANFHSPQISGNQGDPPHQFNPPATSQSPPISASQNPPQFNHQFSPGAYEGRERTSGAYDGRERTFAGRRRRPSHRGGKGWRPAR